MSVLSPADPTAILPTEFRLYAASPNSFNPSTTIAYDIASNTHVRLRVFNSLGGLVTTLMDNAASRGRYQVIWKGTDESGNSAGSGIYFLRLESPIFTSAQKMILIR